MLCIIYIYISIYTYTCIYINININIHTYCRDDATLAGQPSPTALAPRSGPAGGAPCVAHRLCLGGPGALNGHFWMGNRWLNEPTNWINHQVDGFLAIFGWINLDKLAIRWKIGSKMAIYQIGSKWPFLDG